MDVPILRFDRHNPQEPHILPVARSVSLEITRGRVQQRIRAVRRPAFLIGTATDCDLVLGDLSFPEAYAYLLVHDGRVTIRHLGSGPPLMIGGEPADAAELLHGDVVSFGPFELRVLFAKSAPLDRAQKPRPVSLSPDGGLAIHSFFP